MLSSFFFGEMQMEKKLKKFRQNLMTWHLDRACIESGYPFVCGACIAYIRSIKSLSDNYSKVAKCFIQYFQWKTKFWSLNQVTIAINRLIFANIYSFWFAYQILYSANKFIHIKLVFTWLYNKMALIAVNSECCNANTLNKYQFLEWNTMSCAQIRFTTDRSGGQHEKWTLHLCLNFQPQQRHSKTYWHSTN